MSVPTLNFYRVAKFVILTVTNSILAYICAFQLRFEFDFIDQVSQHTVGLGLALLIAARIIAYLLFRAADVNWRYYSLAEFGPVFRAHAASSVIFAAAVLLFKLPGFPRSIFFIEFMVSLMLNAGVSLLIRTLFERGMYPFRKGDQESSRDCLVLGAGDSGHLLVKMLWAQRYQPIGVLDDAERLQNSLVHRVPVVGKLSDLEDVLSRFSSVELVFLAIPSLSAARTTAIKKVCDRRQIELRHLQSVEDIAVRRTTEASSDVPIELILNRQIQVEHEHEVMSTYRDQKILVTGGAGSIGSEVIRQLALLNPKHVVVLDSAEYFLFLFEKELKERYPGLSFECVLSDITDVRRLEHIFKSSKPDVVVHTAAYKHVPLMELNPYAAFSTNVLGTLNVVQGALDIQAERLIILSSDKAVNPVNVMGCTKRIAEILTQALVRSARNTATKAGIVRFGNVINSRGSVIPLFREQIMAGGPITVTDPNVERFFMSTQEAVHLMLAAGTLGQRAEIFALDMGEKIKIADVAREMLTLYGRDDIPIVFTGLRPGERLTEEVTASNEALEETKFDKVRKIAEQLKTDTILIEKIIGMASDASALTGPDLSNRLFGLLNLSQE